MTLCIKGDLLQRHLLTVIDKQRTGAEHILRIHLVNPIGVRGICLYNKEPSALCSHSGSLHKLYHILISLLLYPIGCQLLIIHSKIGYRGILGHIHIKKGSIYRCNCLVGFCHIRDRGKFACRNNIHHPAAILILLILLFTCKSALLQSQYGDNLI